MNFLRATVLHSPVIIRGALWVLIAMGTHWVDKTQDLVDPAKLHATSWYFWILTGIATLLQGAISARTYLDQSYARHVEETKPVSIVNHPGPAPVP